MRFKRKKREKNAQIFAYEKIVVICVVKDLLLLKNKTWGIHSYI